MLLVEKLLPLSLGDPLKRGILRERFTKREGEKMEAGSCFPTLMLTESNAGRVDQFSAFEESRF